MKIALVHDYIKEFGGAERVLMTLHEMFPEAPIYTIYNRSNQLKTIQSWFGYLPFAEKLISPLRFLIPLIWASFDFSQYDLVISSASWAITKGFANGKTREICYCHTPPRYLYGYDTSHKWDKWYLKLYAMPVNHFMRLYDFLRSQKTTQFVANSKETAARIKKFYRRDAVVIYPPVEIRDPDGHRDDGKYYLAGGRLELAKNFDLIIKACNQLKVPLKIFGKGSQEESLRKIAGPTIEFVGWVEGEEKALLYSGAKAFIIAARDEDFGITPVEAMAVGTPVIAYKGGGYLETVTDKTGVFFDEYNVESLIKAMKAIKAIKFNKKDLQEQAAKFSKENFMTQIANLIKNNYEKK